MGCWWAYAQVCTQNPPPSTPHVAPLTHLPFAAINFLEKKHRGGKMETLSNEDTIMVFHPYRELHNDTTIFPLSPMHIRSLLAYY